MRSRRKARGACSYGRAFALFESYRIEIESFLDGGKRCVFRLPNTDLVELLVPEPWWNRDVDVRRLPEGWWRAAAGEVELDATAHGPAVHGQRCQRCWSEKLEAEAADRAAAAAKRAATPPSPAPPIADASAPAPTPAQGAFAWAA
jgi:hypothetical protein